MDALKRDIEHRADECSTSDGSTRKLAPGHEITS